MVIITQAESAKYLCLHLDGRHYVRQNAMQIRHKVRDMYGLFRRKSKFNLKFKKLNLKVLNYTYLNTWVVPQL